VIENVWHCDIASLYPSTILAFDCVPKSDTLGIFKRMVADLRSYRLDAKKAAKVVCVKFCKKGGLVRVGKG
jgi:DNA polymerase, archaea type